MHRAICNISTMFASCSCNLSIFLVLSVYEQVMQGEKHVHYIAELQFILIKLYLMLFLSI